MAFQVYKEIWILIHPVSSSSCDVTLAVNTMQGNDKLDSRTIYDVVIDITALM